MLAKALQVSAYDLDDMLHGKAPIPTWLFLRAVDYVNEAEQGSIAAQSAGAGAVSGFPFDDLLVHRKR